MNKFFIAAIVAILVFIIIIVAGGYTERYSTYYGNGVSFQYPMGWNVTKEPLTSLVLKVFSTNNIGVESTRIVIYERQQAEIQDLTMYLTQGTKYSTKNKIVTEYYGKDDIGNQPDSTIFIVQTEGRIFSVFGETQDKKYLKRVVDTLIVT